MREKNDEECEKMNRRREDLKTRKMKQDIQLGTIVAPCSEGKKLKEMKTKLRVRETKSAFGNR